MTIRTAPRRVTKTEKIKFIILNKSLADRAFADLEIMNSSAKLLVLGIRAEFSPRSISTYCEIMANIESELKAPVDSILLEDFRSYLHHLFALARYTAITTHTFHIHPLTLSYSHCNGSIFVNEICIIRKRR